MGKNPQKVNKQGMAENGNGGLAIGALWGVGSFACPCPFCIGASAFFILNGVRQKAEGILWK